MNWDEPYCPSWPGGLAVPKRKYCEATFVGTDGVVVQTRTNHLNYHPVRSLSMLRDILLMSRPPPLARRGNSAHSDSFTRPGIHHFGPRIFRIPFQCSIQCS